jgi:hypothetical protein
MFPKARTRTNTKPTGSTAGEAENYNASGTHSAIGMAVPPRQCGRAIYVNFNELPVVRGFVLKKLLARPVAPDRFDRA